jgi:phospholipase D3/4
LITNNDRNVTVKILVADWNHTHPGQKIVLKSLEAFGKDFCSHAAGEKKLPWCTGYMEIKMMKIPDPTYEVYPFTRVNHSKFVVTESQVYISTNNWSRDYFYSTGGISFVSDGKDTRNTLQALFDRDFNSKYSKSL